ncbi:energy transducer TonB [Pseudoalteromonas sp. TB64]|uniref:energy transducer TonB n=1 Tax=Pseudoalteromonas sp. TB64 TaxID=1938600 RepID=UPI00040D89F2|nr:energy transducer TonB [Pseudoalteromonas sp. TB64]
MKFIIFVFCSALIHFIGLFIQTETDTPITFLEGQKADRVSINLIDSQPVISQSPAPKASVQPVSAVKPTLNTEFSGEKQHVSKVVKPDDKPVTKPVIKKEPSKVKPQLKPMVNQEVVLKNELVVNNSAQSEKPPEPKTPDTKADSVKAPAPMSSAAKLSEQNSATSQLVKIATLPLFKAPKPALSYPLRAKKRGYEGIAMLQIELNKNGEIAKLTLLKSSGFAELDKAALNNVAQWQFYPVLKNNHPIKALFSVPIKFSLNA